MTENKETRVGAESEYPPMTEAEIRAVAMGIIDGTAFCSWMVRDEDRDMLPQIFLPLMFIDDIERKKLRRDGIEHLYAWEKDRASEMLMNGYACYARARLMSRADALRVNELMKVMKSAMENTEMNAVKDVEHTMVAERDIPKRRGLISAQEWAEVVPPFIHYEVNFDQWGKLEYEIACKYIGAKATGWVYYENKCFIFEQEDDFVLFKMWAENRPMHGGVTQIA